MGPYCIRDVNPASGSDLGSIQRICNYYIGREGDVATFEEDPVSQEDMATRVRDTLDKGFWWLVAVGQGADGSDEVQGYAYANFFKPRSAYRFSAETSIYIDPAQQRQGLGRALMEELLRRLRGKGMRQAVAILGTQEDNPGSHRLHSALGFQEVAHLRDIGFKHDRFVDRVWMQLAL